MPRQLERPGQRRRRQRRPTRQLRGVGQRVAHHSQQHRDRQAGLAGGGTGRRHSDVHAAHRSDRGHDSQRRLQRYAAGGAHLHQPLDQRRQPRDGAWESDLQRSPGSGQLVQFDFGTIGNPANGNNADDFVQIEIVVRIDNVAANQNNVARKNGEQAAGSLVTVTYGSGPPTTVTFDADGATPGIQGRAVTVQEPVLATSKVVAPTSQALGDVVTYSITVSHAGASTANAFDVVLTDTLPSGVTFVPGSVNPPGVFGGIAGQVLSFNVGTLTLAAARRRSATRRASRRRRSSVHRLPTRSRGAFASLPGATGASRLRTHGLRRHQRLHARRVHAGDAQPVGGDLPDQDGRAGDRQRERHPRARRAHRVHGGADQHVGDDPDRRRVHRYGTASR